LKGLEIRVRTSGSDEFTSAAELCRLVTGLPYRAERRHGERRYSGRRCRETVG